MEIPHRCHRFSPVCKIYLQVSLDRLEEQANKNLIKFSKDNCKVLHVGKYNPGAQHRIGFTRLEGSSEKGDLGWITSSLSEECATEAKKANRVQGCISKSITSRDK